LKQAYIETDRQKTHFKAVKEFLVSGPNDVMNDKDLTIDKILADITVKKGFDRISSLEHLREQKRHF
jgi:hypothetical protein